VTKQNGQQVDRHGQLTEKNESKAKQIMKTKQMKTKQMKTKQMKTKQNKWKQSNTNETKTKQFQRLCEFRDMTSWQTP